MQNNSHSIIGIVAVFWLLLVNILFFWERINHSSLLSRFIQGLPF